jgi:hypothetical protein
MAPLAGEAVRGTLMRGAMNADVGDFDLPLAELRAEILLVDEAPAGQEVTLKYFTPDSTLPLVRAR